MELTEARIQHSVQHRARFVEALAAARSGPTPEALANAPVLNNWRFVLAGDRPKILGRVDGNPRDTETSAVVAVFRAQNCARTQSRWYILGTPAAEADANTLYALEQACMDLATPQAFDVAVCKEVVLLQRTVDAIDAAARA